ncbi:Co2+/Mg2+ efflux protein ApaG [Oceanospirillum beijerinckii]|uniref:Co2+/Mg2+ efflux protein ApaG n=1 Tax=Oceanospirillum beijerinckii TaxID=64976 RepID=UPI0003FF26FC|nr:Co2+/Mg2+ efflux protein ApaG [Oceanospirillum beijerinckii]MAC46067.1 Co2+/Mg2+ efflux protein ApaG [Oceanospirillum sp.]
MTDQSAVSSLVEVQVEPGFIRFDGDKEEKYIFNYKVTITNRNKNNIQLVSRAWIITDGNGKVSEVKGKGVVGEQPIIAPGESFHYTSGCVFPTPIGFMQGHYSMLDIEMDSYFTVAIPVFRLAQQASLH